jgi:hypothetical protein
MAQKLLDGVAVIRNALTLSCPFKDDWDDLRLREPVPVTGDPIDIERLPKVVVPYPLGPDDIEVDWDTLRATNQVWYVALFDELGRIPGTLKRFRYQADSVWGFPTNDYERTASHIALWKPDEEPTLVKLSKDVKLPCSDIFYSDGHVGPKQPPITISPVPVLTSTNITWTFAGTGVPLITTSTSSSNIIFTSWTFTVA